MKKVLCISLMVALCFTACNNNNTATKDDKATEQTDSHSESNSQASKIKLVPVTETSEFPDAKLSLKTPDLDGKVAAGTATFDFGVENYELGSQTPDAKQKMCANSEQGQHIHFILDNQPYSAHYESKFEKDLPEGVHVLLAFLSRSYHESLKHKEAAILKTFVAGNPENKNLPNMEAPHLFYSRPKGSYIGEDAIKRVMLDFYLVNTDLSADGNKVKVTINETHDFVVDKWQPYMIEGLADGEHKIQLQLIDKNGNLIRGPFNNVLRTFKTFKSEPIKE